LLSKFRITLIQPLTASRNKTSLNAAQLVLFRTNYAFSKRSLCRFNSQRYNS